MKRQATFQDTINSKSIFERITNMFKTNNFDSKFDSVFTTKHNFDVRKDVNEMTFEEKMTDIIENYDNADTRFRCSICGEYHDVSELQMAPQVEAHTKQVALAILHGTEMPVFSGVEDDNFYCDSCYEKKFGKREC